MKIRQEINLTDAEISSTGTVTVNDLSVLDTTKYSGSPTYYFEVVYTGAASNTGTIKLRDVTGASDIVSIAGATDTNWHITRSSFTPTAGAREYTLKTIGDGVRSQGVRSARIIILQNETAITATATQNEIGNLCSGLNNTSEADITNPKLWKYTAANWDGTKSFEVEVVWTTSAKNTCTIKLCRTSDNATNVTIVNAGSNSTGYTRTRVSFTPVDGETYKLRSLGSTTKSTYSIACGKIIITQTNSPTKLELQQLIIADPTGATGVANRFTTWTSTEWDAGTGTISYYHAMDSDNSLISCKLRDITAGADVASSTVTGTGQQVSSALTFTSGDNIDASVIVVNPSASRILVVYAFVAAAVRRIFVTGG